MLGRGEDVFLDEEEVVGIYGTALIFWATGAFPARYHPEILVSLRRKQISDLQKPCFSDSSEDLWSCSKSKKVCLPITALCEHILLTLLLQVPC